MMDIRVEQGCPQCGAVVILQETDRLLTCSFCGTRNYLQGNGPFRYVLPLPYGRPQPADMLLTPYLRFKGTIFLVTSQGIRHRVVDTTQVANPVPGLPPSLGVRPQAMQLRRVERSSENRYLPQTLKASAIVAKASAVSSLTAQAGQDLLHRAYIGENISYIYLPLVSKQEALFDGVTDKHIVDLANMGGRSLRGRAYNDAWQLRFLATLCPHCGAGLDGAGDCQVMGCSNCHSAWSFAPEGLIEVDWRMLPGDLTTEVYLPFWKIATRIPSLGMHSFADFVERTNQPFLPRSEWREQVLSLWVPAVKLRPKIFLQAGRQATLGQWRINPVAGKVVPNLFPVTLPASEARQALKLILAASTASPRLVYPYLPQVQLTDTVIQLVYLPFTDQGHDWVQPDTGIVIGKNILRFGRSM
jgi:ribosomal protein S27AE